MRIDTLLVGNNSTNCYILSEGTDAVIIDPGDAHERIVEHLAQHGLELRCVILTHGHFDHFLGAAPLLRDYPVPMLCHEDEFNTLTDGARNGSAHVLRHNVTIAPDKTVTDGEIIHIGGIKLTVLHTPGHTPGSMCLIADGCIFTGDTLFFETIGRTDLPGGNFDNIIQSIKKLYQLGDWYTCYPGHGPKTTISYEKENNAYVQE